MCLVLLGFGFYKLIGITFVLKFNWRFWMTWACRLSLLTISPTWLFDL